MYLKTKPFFSVLLCLLCTVPVQAGLFGISPKDRQEFVDARETFNHGNYQQAIVELSNYIYKTKNIKRREARAYRLLGLSYENLNQPEKALEVYLEALEFHDKDVPLLLAAAALYQRTGLTDRSIELYDQALKLENDNLEALAGQAENYLDMGFYSKARQYYDKFFRLNPRAPAVNRARYAYTFLKQRNFADAFINITMAKMEEPSNATYWLLSARAYKGLGRTDDALADLDTAILLDPQRQDIKSTRAMWLYQAGLYTRSYEETQKLLAENPENELALFMNFLNLRQQGKKEQARQQLQKINDLGKDSFAHRIAEKLLSQTK